MADPDYSGMDRWRADQEKNLAPLRGEGGGGTSGPMEPRIIALEEGFKRIEQKLDRLGSDIADVKSDVKSLVPDLAELKGQVRAMPTAIQLLLAVVAIFTASGMLRYFGH
jgi:hypothetical protein